MESPVEQPSGSHTTRAIMQEFTGHLVADGKSPATIESYVGDVEGFVAFLK